MSMNNDDPKFELANRYALHLFECIEKEEEMDEKQTICSFFEKYPNILNDYDFKTPDSIKLGDDGVDLEKYCAFQWIFKCHMDLVKSINEELKELEVVTVDEEVEEVVEEDNESEDSNLNYSEHLLERIYFELLEIKKALPVKEEVKEAKL